MPDFLGFGASRSPPSTPTGCTSRRTSWRRCGRARASPRRRSSRHDYAVSVTQELLARAPKGRSAVELERVHLLNGGLYPDLHRPQPTQTALLDPEQGPRI